MQKIGSAEGIWGKAVVFIVIVTVFSSRLLLRPKSHVEVQSFFLGDGGGNREYKIRSPSLLS